MEITLRSRAQRTSRLTSWPGTSPICKTGQPEVFHGVPGVPERPERCGTPPFLQMPSKGYFSSKASQPFPLPLTTPVKEHLCEQRPMLALVSVSLLPSCPRAYLLPKTVHVTYDMLHIIVV